MDIDINLLRSLATVFIFVTFIWICIWAYSSKRKSEFSDAANLPFADEDLQTEEKRK
jgi:cytochrome c oxidase cbb3-type subunit 4